jgi:hypothetical protein
VLRHFHTHSLLDETDALGMLTWQGSGGFSIDASVRIEGDDRAGIERLLRYCARPPFALERLHALGGVPSLSSPHAQLLYRFPRPTPKEVRAPPRIHRQRYHGVLAPNARSRQAVVAIGRPQAAAPTLVHAPPTGQPTALPLLCPACGGTMSILAFLTEAPVVSAIMPSPGLCRVA